MAIIECFCIFYDTTLRTIENGHFCRNFTFAIFLPYTVYDLHLSPLWTWDSWTELEACLYSLQYAQKRKLLSSKTEDIITTLQLVSIIIVKNLWMQLSLILAVLTVALELARILTRHTFRWINPFVDVLGIKSVNCIGSSAFKLGIDKLLMVCETQNGLRIRPLKMRFSFHWKQRSISNLSLNIIKLTHDLHTDNSSWGEKSGN